MIKCVCIYILYIYIYITHALLFLPGSILEDPHWKGTQQLSVAVANETTFLDFLDVKCNLVQQNVTFPWTSSILNPSPPKDEKLPTPELIKTCRRFLAQVVASLWDPTQRTQHVGNGFDVESTPFFCVFFRLLHQIFV